MIKRIKRVQEFIINFFNFNLKNLNFKLYRKFSSNSYWKLQIFWKTIIFILEKVARVHFKFAVKSWKRSLSIYFVSLRRFVCLFWSIFLICLFGPFKKMKQRMSTVWKWSQHTFKYVLLVQELVINKHENKAQA